jgi:hypothetical protein
MKFFSAIPRDNGVINFFLFIQKHNNHTSVRPLEA